VREKDYKESGEEKKILWKKEEKGLKE